MIRSYGEERAKITGSEVIAARRLRRIRRMRGEGSEMMYLYKSRYTGRCSINAYIGDKRLFRARSVLAAFLFNHFLVEKVTGERASQGSEFRRSVFVVENRTCESGRVKI